MNLIASLEPRTGSSYNPGWFQDESLAHLLFLKEKGILPKIRKFLEVEPWMPPKTGYSVRPIQILLMAISLLGLMGDPEEDGPKLMELLTAGLDVPDDPEWRKRHPKPRKTCRPI